MASVIYKPTRLQKLGGNKKGILKPDSDGYYTMIVGALNSKNTFGEFYSLEGAEEHFRPTSSFQKRVAEGQCYGEEGHPVMTSTTKPADFIRRVLRVDGKNVCVHWKTLELDDQVSKRSDNELQPGAVAMIGTFKPAGPFGPSLQASMENSAENVAFSVRTIIDEPYEVRGVVNKDIKAMVTLDKVIGPGMRGSSKWNAPSLENDEIVITPKLVANLENSLTNGSVSLESDATLLKEFITVLDQHGPEEVESFWKEEVEPGYYNWTG